MNPLETMAHCVKLPYELAYTWLHCNNPISNNAMDVISTCIKREFLGQLEHTFYYVSLYNFLEIFILEHCAFICKLETTNNYAIQCGIQYLYMNK